MGQYRIAHIRSVQQRPNYWVCRGTNLSLTVIVYLYEINLAGPIPAPHTTRFVVRSDELRNSKYGRSATGAERPILIRSTYYACTYILFSPCSMLVRFRFAHGVGRTPYTTHTSRHNQSTTGMASNSLQCTSTYSSVPVYTYGVRGSSDADVICPRSKR